MMLPRSFGLVLALAMRTSRFGRKSGELRRDNRNFRFPEAARPNPAEPHLGPRRKAKMLDLTEDAERDVGAESRCRVATYRAYILDGGGRMVRPAVVFEAVGDESALARARALVGANAHI